MTEFFVGETKGLAKGVYRAVEEKPFKTGFESVSAGKVELAIGARKGVIESAIFVLKRGEISPIEVLRPGEGEPITFGKIAALRTPLKFGIEPTEIARPSRAVAWFKPLTTSEEVGLIAYRESSAKALQAALERGTTSAIAKSGAMATQLASAYEESAFAGGITAGAVAVTGGRQAALTRQFEVQKGIERGFSLERVTTISARPIMPVERMVSVQRPITISQERAVTIGGPYLVPVEIQRVGEIQIQKVETIGRTAEITRPQIPYITIPYIPIVKGGSGDIGAFNLPSFYRPHGGRGRKGVFDIAPLADYLGKTMSELKLGRVAYSPSVGTAKKYFYAGLPVPTVEQLKGKVAYGFGRLFGKKKR